MSSTPPNPDDGPAPSPPRPPTAPPAAPAAPPPAPAHPTGTLCLVFTDIQGSTGLWEKLGDKFAPVLELHNRLMREALEEHRGYEVKTVGDAFMIAFQDPLDAVEFAIDALEMFGVTAWPESTGELLVRIGAHTGEPIVDIDPRTGRVDYFGPMVNCSARIESAAHGGQILIGKSTQAAIHDRLKNAELADLGEHRLKGIDNPERIFQVLSPRVPTRDFPPIATLTSLPTNLPFQQTSFIGREKELADVQAMLAEAGTRLVTVTGPGGTGKTRFSLRMGNLVLDQFPGGVWVANLARAKTVEDVSATVAAALGLQLAAGSGGESPEKLVANVLEYRKPLLLLLDNFEQVAQHAPATVGLWMSRAPKAKFLVTSQAILAIAGEHEYRLGALSVPPRAGERDLLDATSTRAAMSYDSVRLFVERAREVSPGFALAPDNAADITTLCAELDGIPLALELAAARVRIMAPAQMVQRLAQKFQLLRSSRRDLPERHQTLQAAIEWSYELLSDWEKACFQQACAFRGGFSLEAAEAVIDLLAFPDAPFPMDAVQMLREKSFLTTRETPFGARFHMFRSMREFGESKWSLSPELQDRHAAYYARYAEEWEALRLGPRMVEALNRLEQKRENILVAIDRMTAMGKLDAAARLAIAIAGFLLARGTGRQRVAPLESLRAAIDAKPEGVAVPVRARLLTALAQGYERMGEYKPADQLAAAALALIDTPGADPVALAEALTTAAEAKRAIAALDEALALHDRAEALYRAGADQLGIARNLGGRAMILLTRGDLDAAGEALEQARSINRERNNTPGLIANLSNLARVRRARRDYDAAAALYAEAEQLCREIGDAALCARVIGNRAVALQDKGDIDAGLACQAEAERLFREMGDRVNAMRVVGNRGDALWRRGSLQESLQCFEEALRVMREAGQRRSVGAFAASRAGLLLELDRAAEAIDAADEALGILTQVGALYTQDSFVTHASRALALAAAPRDGRKARDDARIALQLAGFLRIHERPPNEGSQLLLQKLGTIR